MMWSMYGCVYIVTVILFSYGVNSQNYYHTLEPTRDGYEYVTNRAKPEPFTLYGTPIPQNNGKYENVQTAIPSVFYKYPVTYKVTQETPVKVMASAPFHENKEANVQITNIPTNNIDKNNDLTPKVESYLIDNDLTPKVETYLITKRSNNDDDKNLILDTQEYIESDNNDATHTVEEGTNNKYSDKENIEIENKIVESAWNETTADKGDFDNKDREVTRLKDKIDFDDKDIEVTKLKDLLGILSNKSNGEIKLIGEPFIKIMNVNIGTHNLRRNAHDEVSRPLLEDLDTKERKDEMKRIVITLPDSDTTTVIINSKKENGTSQHTKEEPQNQRNTHLLHNLHEHKHRNMGPNKPIGTNTYKPSPNRKMWPIPSAYPINFHKASSPYSDLYPYKYLKM